MDFLKQNLDDKIKHKLLDEFKNIKFIQKSLHTLLQNKFYNTIKQETLTLHYIPIKQLTKSKIVKVFNRLLTIIHLYNIEKELVIWFIPCKEKRYFPKEKEIINPVHINGGYTYPMLGTIYIYRLEEFPKVMLHEVIHHSIIDTDIPKEVEFPLYKQFSLDTTNCDTSCKYELRTNEAVIEVWALLHHLNFIAQEYKIPFYKLLTEELNWNLYLCKKIFIHQKKYFNDWKEETSSYSYIRLKTCILYFLTEFFKLKYPYHPKDLIHFFIKYNLNKKFITAINHAKEYNTNTFRMTVNGDK